MRIAVTQIHDQTAEHESQDDPNDGEFTVIKLTGSGCAEECSLFDHMHAVTMLMMTSGDSNLDIVVLIAMRADWTLTVFGEGYHGGVAR